MQQKSLLAGCVLEPILACEMCFGHDFGLRLCFGAYFGCMLACVLSSSFDINQEFAFACFAIFWLAVVFSH